MYTTDVIVEEINNRALRRIGPDGQLMKEAARAAQRRLIATGEVMVEALEVADSIEYGGLLQQLRGLAAAKKTAQDEVDLAERHGGEASAILLCGRMRAAETKVVFLTNDGDACRVAAQRRIDVRHFGHALHELVCAGLLTAEKAWSFYTPAVGMSGIPHAATLRSAGALVCSGTTDDCAACALQSH